MTIFWHLVISRFGIKIRQAVVNLCVFFGVKNWFLWSEFNTKWVGQIVGIFALFLYGSSGLASTNPPPRLYAQCKVTHFGTEQHRFNLEARGAWWRSATLDTHLKVFQIIVSDPQTRAVLQTLDVKAGLVAKNYFHHVCNTQDTNGWTMLELPLQFKTVQTWIYNQNKRVWQHGQNPIPSRRFQTWTLNPKKKIWQGGTIRLEPLELVHRSSKYRMAARDLRFETWGYLAKSPSSDETHVELIRVLDAKTNEVVQDMIVDASPVTEAELDIGDFNFDGYTDIGIMLFLPAAPNIPHAYWTYQRRTGQFVHDEVLSKITSAEFDQKKKIISEFYRASCCIHGVNIYKYIAGKLTLIENTDFGLTADGKDYWTRSLLVAGSLQVVDGRLEWFSTDCKRFFQQRSVLRRGKLRLVTNIARATTKAEQKDCRVLPR